MTSGLARPTTSATASASRMSISLERRAVRERPLEVLPLAGGEVVDDGHLVAAREERVDEVRSDEPGAAGDEGLHAAADPSQAA